MQKVISLASLEEWGALLLVKKKDVWILPGGKPEGSENAEETIRREVNSEELPYSSLMSRLEFWRSFQGESPHGKKPIEVDVWFGTITGSIIPGREITEAGFFTWEEIEQMPLSEVTREIVKTLRAENHL